MEVSESSTGNPSQCHVTGLCSATGLQLQCGLKAGHPADRPQGLQHLPRGTGWAQGREHRKYRAGVWKRLQAKHECTCPSPSRSCGWLASRLPSQTRISLGSISLWLMVRRLHAQPTPGAGPHTLSGAWTTVLSLQRVRPAPAATAACDQGPFHWAAASCGSG